VGAGTSAAAVANVTGQQVRATGTTAFRRPGNFPESLIHEQDKYLRYQAFLQGVRINTEDQAKDGKDERTRSNATVSSVRHRLVREVSQSQKSEEPRTVYNRE
jgi:hypothetical protein